MPQNKIRTPSYRRHKASGQAVVTLNCRDRYLGKYDSPESHAEYRRLIAEWLTSGASVSPRGDTPASAIGSKGDLAMSEFMVRYVEFADRYYRKNGKPTSEPGNVRDALGPVKLLYAHVPAREFSPLSLQAVREQMIAADLCRNEVNKRVGKIVRMFKWGVENELVPPDVYAALKAVSGLRKGRSEARESEPVRPVSDAVVDAVRPHVARQVWAMIELQRLTGMRPGEVCRMRTIDIDTIGRTWVYRPAGHKTEHHGRSREVAIGPKAQAILKPWLRPKLDEFLFSPAEAMAERLANRRQSRKSPMTPSQSARRAKARRRRAPGLFYCVSAYGHAIRSGCRKAGVPAWHPNQLRHSAATRIRREFGIDAARAVLGHSSPAITEIYAERDRNAAAVAMERLG